LIAPKGTEVPETKVLSNNIEEEREKPEGRVGGGIKIV
jgi:hypothetical protein